MSDSCWVVTEDGFHMVYTSEGKPIGVIEMTRVIDKAGDIPSVLVKMICNLAGSTKEMLEGIEQCRIEEEEYKKKQHNNNGYK